MEGGFDKFAVPPPLLARSLNLLSAAKAKGGRKGSRGEAGRSLQLSYVCPPPLVQST